ncbi:hypothetical protein K488DRAFT_56126 [Vararia minispora EC-137]|uniref:Uncharacterized protein n=1 Tax=Vararia minispora EC-137 TaxID=1314806 RepID=A0ACB8QCK9_9AGAM|nr:hypothetical protein K488DRAFT_56126 [Vararia minispora EC-137]
MSHSRPRNPHLFPESSYVASLDAWAANLQTAGTYLEAKSCTIEHVVHYKASSDMEHEYLVVHARHSSGALVVLGVDRNAEEHMDQATSSRYITNAISLFSGRGRSSDEDRGVVAFDGVEVSHDGTAEPITSRHGPSIELNTLSFSSRSDSGSRTAPTLHNLTVLLLVIRSHFPAYMLLRHQCYFFARATLLSLSTIFPSRQTPHPENYALQGTWRGAHVSLFAAGKTAIQNMLLLPLIEFPVLLVPAGLFALYTTVSLYDGHTVTGPRDRLEISDEKIREFDIPGRYREAWDRYTWAMGERTSG